MYQCRLCYKDLPSRISIFNNSLYFVNRCTVCFQVFKSLSYSILSCCLKVNKTHLHWRQLHNLHIRLMRQEIIGIDLRVLCHGLSLIAILINARPRAALSGGFFVPVAVLRPAGSGPPPRVPDSPPLFQSTLPVWGATYIKLLFAPQVPISIHAPRVGSDHRPDRGAGGGDRISIHAPRVGSDGKRSQTFWGCFIFQSTLPVWGATWKRSRRTIDAPFQSTLPVWGATFCGSSFDFNPRSPCGERRENCRRSLRSCTISIHAPRVGSDRAGEIRKELITIFQSTLPVWGATRKKKH